MARNGRKCPDLLYVTILKKDPIDNRERPEGQRKDNGERPERGRRDNGKTPGRH